MERGVFVNGKLYLYDDMNGEVVKPNQPINESMNESGIQNNLSFGNFEGSEEIMHMNL